MSIGKKRWILRSLVAAGVCFVLLITGLVLAFIWVRPAPTEIRLSGSSQQMGAVYGKKVSWQLKLLNDLYLNRIVCQNDQQLIRRAHAAALSQTVNWPSSYVEEVFAMAETSGVTTGALTYANCFLDIGHVRAGCRSVVAGTNGVFLHAHNLDWDSIAGLGRWTTCIIRRQPSDGRFKTVAVGFPGLIGSFDIINEKGLALSFNQLGTSKGSTNEPIFIMIRRIAESCSSLAEARREILSCRPGMPFILTVSDAAAQTGSIFERSHETVIERPMSDGWVAACNVSQDQQRGTTSLDRLLAETPITERPLLQKILGDDRVMQGSNLYSVIFDFTNDRMFLASGTVPAAASGFREFRLFGEAGE